MKAINQFVKYSQEYGCSIAKAIADRDWPMTKEMCVKAFKESAGREPSDSEIIEMSPDRSSAVSYEAELQDHEDFDFGRR